MRISNAGEVELESAEDRDEDDGLNNTSEEDEEERRRRRRWRRWRRDEEEEDEGDYAGNSGFYVAENQSDPEVSCMYTQTTFNIH